LQRHFSGQQYQQDGPIIDEDLEDETPGFQRNKTAVFGDSVIEKVAEKYQLASQ
jgi:hypothetical protein